MKNSKQKSTMVAILGIFTAITVVLQLISYTVKIGTFNLSLVLIPIVLASVLYGPKYGAFLGAAFGIVTAIASGTGLDAGGNILFNASPFMTIAVCLLKGTLCGFTAGLVAKSFKGRYRTLSTFSAAVTAPLVNTCVFVICMFLFFKDILYSWAGDTNVISYIIVGLVGLNFLIELFINLILTPTIIRVIDSINKM